jgi:eukaryotic-like serine/threonine-protein kinase
MSIGSLPVVGDTIAGLTILRRVGEGASGVVYEARNGSAHSHAIKILRPEAAEDDTLLREFVDEAHATGSVEHKNVVAIRDRGQEGGLHYILMEFVDGPPLDVLLQRNGRLPWKPSTRIVMRLANALAHAHAKGLIHRDVKPANVLLYRDGRPRLTDFGIVKDIGSLKGYLVQGRKVGTPAYASPEQCLGKRLCQATDVYSLGATFYHMVCGVQPFLGDTAADIMRKHVSTSAVPPCEVVTGIPKALSKVIERMLAKKQTDRFPSLERLVHDLDMIVEGKVAINVPGARPRVNTAALRGLHRTRTSRHTD